MSFANLLDETASHLPDKLALIEGDKRVSFAELDAMKRRAGAELIVAGIRAGDRVAVHMFNRIELAVLYFACAQLGAVTVSVNTRLKPAEIEFILRHSGAVAYIGDADLIPPLLLDQRHRDSIRLVFALGNAGGQTAPYAELLAAQRTTRLSRVEGDQPAIIMYTSGSTARPKGVVYSHRAIMAGAQLGQPGILSDGVIAQATSMMHAGGFSNLVATVHVGATIVLLPRFDADGVLDAIEKHHCNYFAGLPFMFEELVQRQRAKPRAVMSATIFHAGGDTVTSALQERFIATFHHPLREGYGSTEAGRITHQPQERPVRAASIGVPIDGIEVKVADVAGCQVSPGTDGELLIRSPAMMSGHWRDPAASAAALQGGWLRSGDLVNQDADGYLEFRGRLKEIIIRGGTNIAPLEIEQQLANHPAVIECVVIGLPDPVLGERVAAVVRVRPEIPVIESELMAFLRARLADYKVPERISFRTSLPQNNGGKLQRALLREQLLSGLAG